MTGGHSAGIFQKTAGQARLFQRQTESERQRYNRGHF